ncbi:hypothetical protein DFH28DRAFT_856069, partial [Melampsora americana]
MGEPSPQMSDDMYDTLVRIKESIEHEGLTIPSFIHWANQIAKWEFIATLKDSTRIEKTVDIYRFIKQKDMTVLRFLHTLLNLNYVELGPSRTEWLADTDPKRGRIIILLDMIKAMVYSSGNGDNLWKLYIHREV